MTNSITAMGVQDHVNMSVSGELAALLVENESAQATADHETVRAAREAYLAEAANQVAELREAADSMATGALVGAGLSVAGGACTIVSAQLPKDLTAAKVPTDSAAARDWAALGGVAGQLAKPAQTLLGDSSAESHRASAKQAETAGEADRWQASDSQSDLEATSRRSDKILELAQGISQEQNAANNAIIGRI